MEVDVFMVIADLTRGSLIVICENPKKKEMLKSVSTCLSCEILVENFKCKLHQIEVELNNVCDSHIFKPSLNKDSSCNNCNSYKTDNCSHPEKASDGFLCFDWKN